MSKILVGVSGGVDSAYTCRFLSQKGYDVVGAVLSLHGNAPIDMARNVADKLDIPLVVIDKRELFEEKVISYFVNEYQKGSTPNPCVVCNRDVKIQALLDTADQMGIEKIATGHYVKVGFDEKINRYYIACGEDSNKDQSYFLWRLTQKQLSRLETPLGDFVKKDVVDSAEDIVKASESQEICFIPDNNYSAFLRDKMKTEDKMGNFVDKDGNIISAHSGITNYTVGQRKGLGISVGKPMFVSKIDAESGDIVLADEREIYSSHMFVRGINFVSADNIGINDEFDAKIRYGSKPAKARIVSLDGESVGVEFTQPQRAICPGQSAVFYKNGRVVFGGFIYKK